MSAKPMVPEVREGNLRHKLFELLKEAILSGKIKPGERCNDSLLARQFGVSRYPVREALQQLGEQGLVVNVPRRGTFVVRLTEEDFQKICSIRIVLEAEALRLARANLTPAGKKQLKEMSERMARAGARSFPELSRVDIGFHRAIWKLSGNEHLENILTRLTAPLFAYVLVGALRDHKKIITDTHRPLLEFVLGKSAQSAEEAVLTHLERYPDAGRFWSLRPSNGAHAGTHARSRQ